MTILLLCNRFPPRVDGVGDYTWHLAQAFQRQGLTVHVVCGWQEKIEVPAGVIVHPVVRAWNREAGAAIEGVLRQICPDWLGVQYVPYGFDRRGLPFFLTDILYRLRPSGVRIWITFHEVHVRLHGLRGRIIGALQRRLARSLCREAVFVVTSIEFYQGLLRHFHSQIHVIPVGANLEHTPISGPEKAAWRREWFPDKTFVVSTFGKRNLRQLLLGIQALNDRGIPTGLVICGQNDLPQAFKDLAFVRMTGYLPAEAISRHLQYSDLFVLPDYVSPDGEGGTCTKSGSLAAGFAAGLPIVGIRGDMTNDLLRPGENIWLLPENTAVAFADALARLLPDTALRQRLAEGGSYLFATQLSWPQIAGQYLTFLQPVLPVETPA